MASSNNNSNSSKRGGGDEELKEMTEISKTLKEGERIVAPSRRPDGTLRKPIRIRAGYVPQDEVAIYQSKGALWRKEMQSQEVPPGYDPDSHTKPKTKAVKRNERKKEKRHQQAALEKGKNTEAIEDGNMVKGALPDEDLGHASNSVKSLTSQMNELAVSSNPTVVAPSSDLVDASNMESLVQDIDKRIRALKKKIRLAEAQQQKTPSQDMNPEQLEKLAKLEGWRQELKLLEGKKAEEASS
ncbi:PREDICTED: partner of Y14 and mago-like isoform X1 [Populus euphratica]|uniref:Partner of Y14 and mago-like isoform X1 n=1 Tax=Populus euphratica TaxID=75702 RepID=A0AAJ6VEE2_POPEU|nr:PREDICTED: partner of Y14 and mago-like isoform X1 [Populus euphratica]